MSCVYWQAGLLLHDGVLPHLLDFRDRWLKEDGVMLPETATVSLAPISDPRFWGTGYVCLRLLFIYVSEQTLCRVGSRILQLGGGLDVLSTGPYLAGGQGAAPPPGNRGKSALFASRCPFSLERCALSSSSIGCPSQSRTAP